MYSGNAQITLEYVDDILHAADLFQLDDLKKLCFQYLTQNLSPSNCLTVASLAQNFNHQGIRDESEKVIIANFKLVMSSDIFPSISKSDLLRYVSRVDHQTSWQAALTWARDKNEFPQLVEVMDIQKFPFKFLWETVLEKPLIKESASIKSKVIKRLFSAPEELKDNLVLENCILFKTLAKEHNILDTSVQVITQFMEENFENLTVHRTFINLSKDDLLLLLGSSAAVCSSESVKWEAAKKWVKHDLHERKKLFQDIFGLINLAKLPVTFLQNHVYTESLVKDSKKCSDILMGVLFKKSLELEATAATGTSPAFIMGRQLPGSTAWKVISLLSLPGHEGDRTLKLMCNFPQGCSEGVKYESTRFKAYLPNNNLGQNLYRRLWEAFDAGQLFKLRYKAGEETGEIVWGDIPLKTYKTGGPDNNGYPDPRYLERLHQALRAKGF